jgi:hypothetical protein
MKKTFLITTIALGYFSLMGLLGIIAAVPGNVHKNAKEFVREQITRNISCPDFITDNNPANTVKAIVNVDEAGTVTVNEINSGNAQLKNYVLGQLQNMKVHNTAGPEKFVLVVNFKVD